MATDVFNKLCSLCNLVDVYLWFCILFSFNTYICISIFANFVHVMFGSLERLCAIVYRSLAVHAMMDLVAVESKCI